MIDPSDDPSPLLGAPPTNGRWVDVTSGPAVTRPDNAPTADDLQARIINGAVDKTAKFPYAGLVLWNLGNGYASCTGSLVAPGYVLTAAHVSEHGGVWLRGGLGGFGQWGWQCEARVG